MAFQHPGLASKMSFVPIFCQEIQKGKGQVLLIFYETASDTGDHFLLGDGLEELALPFGENEVGRFWRAPFLPEDIRIVGHFGGRTHALNAPRTEPASKSLKWTHCIGHTLAISESPFSAHFNLENRLAGRLVVNDLDIAELKAASDVVADAMRRAGVNVDYQAVDFGTVVQRRTSKKPPAEGGWSAFCSGFGSYDFSNPAIHLLLRGNGDRAWFGWPTAPEIEALRDAWLDAPDLATQKRLAAEIQVKAFQEVPYIPLGLFYVYSVYRADLSGILHGLPLFWNIRRT